MAIIGEQTSTMWKVEKSKTIDSTCHILSADKKKCFGINYARLHRLGGYGYIGIDDPYCNEETPEKDGIYVTDIKIIQQSYWLAFKT